jgi:hypothetical protein
VRRRLSLALLAAILAVAAIVVAIAYRRPVPLPGDRVASADSAADTLARFDSAQRANARAARDTMCLASRIGLPCDSR